MRSMVTCPRPAARFCWERWPRYFAAPRRELLWVERARNLESRRSTAEPVLVTDRKLPLPEKRTSVYVRAMTTMSGRVIMYFVDRDALAWRVFLFGIITGRRIPYPVGSM